MRKCFNCGKPLETPTLQDEVEAHIEYRENFPLTGSPDDMQLVCHSCYLEMKHWKEPSDWDQEYHDKPEEGGQYV